MTAKMRIFLIGFMGSGKTFWGKRLSQRFEIPHIDLDKYIAIGEGKSISDLFAESGETYFRQLEKKYLSELIATRDHMLLSTGGGTPCFFNNMDLLNASGPTIYLRSTPELLYSRLRHETSVRPLLADTSDENLKRKISSLLQEREPYYQKSQHILEMDQTNDSTFEQIIQRYV